VGPPNAFRLTTLDPPESSSGPVAAEILASLIAGLSPSFEVLGMTCSEEGGVGGGGSSDGVS